MVEVESSGPPWVITWIWVNSANAWMVMVMRMNVRVCRSAGQVMYRNRCQFPAPSMAPASYMSWGMVCRPDSQITMWKPTPCQTDMTRIETSAVLGLPSQSGPSMPNTARKLLINPLGWYSNFHNRETTTIEVTTGRKYTVRKKLTPRILTLISRASTSARPACTGTTNTANSTVLRRDFQNSGSPNKRAKLSKPTNCGPVGEISFALVKASTNVSTIGMMTKINSRAQAGVTSQAAAMRWDCLLLVNLH